MPFYVITLCIAMKGDNVVAFVFAIDLCLVLT